MNGDREMINRENMLKLALHLEDVDKTRFNMNNWVSAYQDDFQDFMECYRLDINDCGTAGCIAGWAVALANNGKIDVIDAEYEELELDSGECLVGDIRHIAAEWLGLPMSKADQLFYFGEDSVWCRYREDYDLDTHPAYCNPSKLQITASSIHPKHAADMLYRILDGEDVFTENGNFL
jgi:hypothetical protein